MSAAGCSNPYVLCMDTDNAATHIDDLDIDLTFSNLYDVLRLKGIQDELTQDDFKRVIKLTFIGLVKLHEPIPQDFRTMIRALWNKDFPATFDYLPQESHTGQLMIFWKKLIEFGREVPNPGPAVEKDPFKGPNLTMLLPRLQRGFDLIDRYLKRHDTRHNLRSCRHLEETGKYMREKRRDK